MKASIGSIEVSDEFLKALAKEHGRRGGKATRIQVKEYVQTVLATSIYELEQKWIESNPIK